MLLKSAAMVSWVLYAKFRIEKHCLVKDFAFLKNVCYLLKVPIILCFEYVIVFVFYELMIDPQPTFLDPGYSSRTVNTASFIRVSKKRLSLVA